MFTQLTLLLLPRVSDASGQREEAGRPRGPRSVVSVSSATTKTQVIGDNCDFEPTGLETNFDVIMHVIDEEDEDGGLDGISVHNPLMSLERAIWDDEAFLQVQHKIIEELQDLVDRSLALIQRITSKPNMGADMFRLSNEFWERSPEPRHPAPTDEHMRLAAEEIARFLAGNQWEREVFEGQAFREHRDYRVVVKLVRSLENMNEELDQQKHLRSTLQDALSRGVKWEASYDTRRHEIQGYRVRKHTLKKAVPINYEEELEQLLLTRNETEFQQAHKALANKLIEAVITIPAKLNEGYTPFSPEKDREMLSESERREAFARMLEDPPFHEQELDERFRELCVEWQQDYDEAKMFNASIEERSTNDLIARIRAAQAAAAGPHDASDPTTQLADDVADDVEKLIALGMVSLEEVMQWPELQQMVKRLRK